MRALSSVLICTVLAGCATQSAVERRYINQPGRPVQAPFSDGVMVGKTLYLAGRIGLEPSGRPPADASAEARLLLESFRSVLAEAGMTMNDLVYVQVFCPDVAAHYDTFNQVYRSFLAAPFPARAFIGSGPLLFGARFEMQGIAVKR